MFGAWRSGSGDGGSSGGGGRDNFLEGPVRGPRRPGPDPEEPLAHPRPPTHRGRVPAASGTCVPPTPASLGMSSVPRQPPGAPAPPAAPGGAGRGGPRGGEVWSTLVTVSDPRALTGCRAGQHSLQPPGSSEEAPELTLRPPLSSPSRPAGTSPRAVGVPAGAPGAWAPPSPEASPTPDGDVLFSDPSVLVSVPAVQSGSAAQKENVQGARLQIQGTCWDNMIKKQPSAP